MVSEEIINDQSDTECYGSQCVYYVGQETHDSYPPGSGNPIFVVDRGNNFRNKREFVSYISIRVMTLDASLFRPADIMHDQIPMDYCTLKDVFCKMVSRFTKSTMGRGTAEPGAVVYEWISLCEPNEVFDSAEFKSVVDSLDKTLLALEAEKADANGLADETSRGGKDS